MVFINLLGDDQGSTTIVGDFADYVISRGVTNNGNSFSGGFEVEKLKIVNGHAEGGGIRIGLAVGGAIRDCDITANFGITTLNQDALIVEGSGSSYSASLEVSIINCNLRAYDDLTGDYTTGSGAIPLSIGIAKTADGPTTNCTFKDYNVAFTGFAGEGCMAVQGCYFEHNNYGMTSNWGPGRILNDGPTATSGINVSGCRFKNNGIAILSAAGISTYRGCSIEASEGTIAGQPQHGVYAGAGGSCVFAGMRITGQYQQAGFALVGGETSRCTVEGIAVSNTSTLGGVTWTMPSTASSGVFRGCNTAAVYTMGQLPAPSLDMRSIGWSSGTTTIDLLHDMGAYIGRTVTVAVSGVTPSGYNGAFTGGTVLDGSHVSYAQSNPGSPTGTTGKAVVNVGTNARQGELYNVSDADASTWGVTTAGAGSTHAKVRWSATNWTVIGK
jgi:hypothetical protein